MMVGRLQRLPTVLQLSRVHAYSSVRGQLLYVSHSCIHRHPHHLQVSLSACILLLTPRIQLNMVVAT